MPSVAMNELTRKWTMISPDRNPTAAHAAMAIRHDSTALQAGLGLEPAHDDEREGEHRPAPTGRTRRPSAGRAAARPRMAMTTWSASTSLNVVWVRNVSGIHSPNSTMMSAEQVEHARPAAARAGGSRAGAGPGATLVTVVVMPMLLGSVGRLDGAVVGHAGSSCSCSMWLVSMSAPTSSATDASAPQHDHPRRQPGQLVACRWSTRRRRRRSPPPGRRGGGCRPSSRRRRPGSARRARAPAACDAQPAGHHDLLLVAARQLGDQLLRLRPGARRARSIHCSASRRSARRRADRRDQNGRQVGDRHVLAHACAGEQRLRRPGRPARSTARRRSPRAGRRAGRRAPSTATSPPRGQAAGEQAGHLLAARAGEAGDAEHLAGGDVEVEVGAQLGAADRPRSDSRGVRRRRRRRAGSWAAASSHQLTAEHQLDERVVGQLAGRARWRPAGRRAGR